MVNGYWLLVTEFLKSMENSCSMFIKDQKAFEGLPLWSSPWESLAAMTLPNSL